MHCFASVSPLLEKGSRRLRGSDVKDLLVRGIDDQRKKVVVYLWKCSMDQCSSMPPVVVTCLP